MARTQAHAKHPSGHLAPVPNPARTRPNGDPGSPSEANRIAHAIDALVKARLEAITNPSMGPEHADEAFRRLVDLMEG